MALEQWSHPPLGTMLLIDNIIISDLRELMLCTLCKTPEIFVKMTSVMTQFDISPFRRKKLNLIQTVFLTIASQQTTTKYQWLNTMSSSLLRFSIGEWAGFIWPRQGLRSIPWVGYKICWMCPSSFLDQQHVLMEKGRNTKGVSKNISFFLTFGFKLGPLSSSHISLVKASPWPIPISME